MSKLPCHGKNAENVGNITEIDSNGRKQKCNSQCKKIFYNHYYGQVKQCMKVETVTGEYDYCKYYNEVVQHIYKLACNKRIGITSRGK